MTYGCFFGNGLVYYVTIFRIQNRMWNYINSCLSVVDYEINIHNACKADLHDFIDETIGALLIRRSRFS